ncbi:MAG: hypothetical protein WEC75_05245 [Dehalococcoidia bacterium]
MAQIAKEIRYVTARAQTMTSAPPRIRGPRRCKDDAIPARNISVIMVAAAATFSLPGSMATIQLTNPEMTRAEPAASQNSPRAVSAGFLESSMSIVSSP